MSDLKTTLAEEVLSNPAVAPALAALLQKVKGGEIDGIDLPTLQKLADKLDSVREKIIKEKSREISPALLAKRDAFLKEYEVKIVDDRKVYIFFRPHMSIRGFLDQAQTLALELYEQPAIDENLIRKLGQWRVFSSGGEERLLAIDACVDETVGKTGSQMEEEGSFFPPPYVTAAHTAYFVATGKDLFRGYMVRVSRRLKDSVGILEFTAKGLSISTYSMGENGGSSGVAALKLLPPETD